MAAWSTRGGRRASGRGSAGPRVRSAEALDEGYLGVFIDVQGAEDDARAAWVTAGNVIVRGKAVDYAGSS